MPFDQVGQYFSVGLSAEEMALADEHLLEREKVFDDPVMHHHNPSGAIGVRMSIFLRGGAVGRPARVPDSIRAIEWPEADEVLKIRELALSATNLQPGAIPGHCNAG